MLSGTTVQRILGEWRLFKGQKWPTGLRNTCSAVSTSADTKNRDKQRVLEASVA